MQVAAGHLGACEAAGCEQVIPVCLQHPQRSPATVFGMCMKSNGFRQAFHSMLERMQQQGRAEVSLAGSGGGGSGRTPAKRSSSQRGGEDTAPDIGAKRTRKARVIFDM